MTTLRRLWHGADPLVFLGVWTAATGASIALVELAPGRPRYGYDGQLQAAVAGAVLILFFLLRRSANARRLALFAATFGVLAGVLGALAPGGDLVEPKFLGLGLLQGAALVSLLAPPLERFVLVRRPPGRGRIDE